MKFTKMEGIGNDYVYVDCTKENIENAAELSIKVSDRHFGIGSDGLILIKPSQHADFTMEMYNADGSRSEMCGNGIRCVGKFVYDHGLTDKTEVDIETLAGVKHLQLLVDEATNKVTNVTVDMGVPVLETLLIPTTVPANIPFNELDETPAAIDVPIKVGGKVYNVTTVSMGNPHCVTFVDDTASFPLEEVGPQFETAPEFPNRVNAEFVQLKDRKTVKMRVWERGSGETLACGTGACAVAIACILNGHTEDEVTVQLLGGDLDIRYDRDSGHVYMTGPATTVFEGEYEI